MLSRVGISLDEALLAQFDRLIERKGYANRSEAIRDLIRAALVDVQWQEGGGTVMGSVVLVYDHHVGDLANKLAHAQHNHFGEVVSTMHVHVDEHNCLEVIVLRGKAKRIRELAEQLISTRGVKHGKFIATTTGKGI